MGLAGMSPPTWPDSGCAVRVLLTAPVTDGAHAARARSPESGDAGQDVGGAVAGVDQVGDHVAEGLGSLVAAPQGGLGHAPGLDPGTDRVTLGGVRVEQGGVGAVDDGGELAAEADRIAEAEVQSLPAGWGV